MYPVHISYHVPFPQTCELSGAIVGDFHDLYTSYAALLPIFSTKSQIGAITRVRGPPSQSHISFASDPLPHGGQLQMRALGRAQRRDDFP
jgi:hypothetical protein